MTAISFSQPNFENQIPKVEKVRTTRLLGNGKRYLQHLHSMNDGKPVRLYWKQRTKDCRLLLEPKIIEMGELRFGVDDNFRPQYGSTFLSDERMKEYALEEGFSSWAEFQAVIEKLHGSNFRDFDYYTIKWRRLSIPDAKGQEGVARGETTWRD